MISCRSFGKDGRRVSGLNGTETVTVPRSDPTWSERVRVSRGLRLVSQRQSGAPRGLRPDFVVMLAPRLDRSPGIVQIHEPVKVQARIAEAAVEAFDECVLRRLA